MSVKPAYSLAQLLTLKNARNYLFAVFVLTIPCLWFPIAAVGIYPLATIILATVRFAFTPVLLILNVAHVVFYAATFFGVAHFGARVLSRLRNTAKLASLVAVTTLLLFVTTLRIWGGSSHGGEMTRETALGASVELLRR